ncbi:hypothetical protein [Candidatus Clostridium radicumherbarum]|uniref:Uncharacterized protein n=1 Tax=Candidatus Clostridium radicumherbarum TaxID=3381662 RepID=A0ABW8TUC9_9CLOT
MNASEFYSLYDEKITSKLIELGFTNKGQSLFLINDDGILALIKSSYRGLRVARIMLCFRHKFEKDLNGKEDNYYSTNPNDYTFKELPKELLNQNISKWHYKPRYVGMGYNYQELNYENANIVEVQKELNNIFLVTSNCGIAWMNILNPQEALKQLRKYNQNDVTEIDWIHDYEDYLNSR